MTTAAPGPVISDPNLLGKGELGVATLANPYEPWLGAPTNEAARDAIAQGRPQTIRNLPEAYKGRNVRLLSFIEEEVFFNDNFLSQVVLPILESEEMGWEWNVWVFNRHLLNPTPYQGVSRYITSETTSGKASTTRYGLAFTLEHGFMNTEAGRTNYYYNLRSIAHAVNETHNFDILRAIISAPKEAEMFAAQTGYYEQKSFDDVMLMDRDQFALFQKDHEAAFQKLDTLTIDQMKSNGANADTWLIPPIISYYLRLVPKNARDYQLAGPAGPERLSSTSISYDSPNAYKEFGDARVYCIRQFNYDKREKLDAMARIRQIGSVVKFLPTGSVDVKHYTKNERDTVIYNEDKDDWHLMRFRQIIENCMLFRETPTNGISTLENPRMSLDDDPDHKHNPFFMESRTRFVGFDGNNDTDSTSMGLRPIEIFGQMRERDLTISTQMLVAQTILKNIPQTSKDEHSPYGDLFRDVENLVNYIERKNNNTWSSRSNLVEYWGNVTKRAMTGNFAPGGGNVVLTPDQLRGSLVTIHPKSERVHRFAAVPALPYDQNTGATDVINRGTTPNTIPLTTIGFTNWYGLTYLNAIVALSDLSEREVVKRGVNAITEIVAQLDRLLPGCLLVDKNRSPGFYPVASAETVFMENALGINGFPMWVNVEIANNEVAAAIASDSKHNLGGGGGARAPINAVMLSQSSTGIQFISQLVRELRDIANQGPGNNAGFEVLLRPETGLAVGGLAGFPDATIGDHDILEGSRYRRFISQLRFPFAPHPTDNNYATFESMQRFLNFVDVVKRIDMAKLRKSSVADIKQFLANLNTRIESITGGLNLTNNTFNLGLDALRTLVSRLPQPSRLDAALNEWLVQSTTAGWFDFGQNPEDALRLFINTMGRRLTIATALDRQYIEKGIPPKWGLSGQLDEASIALPRAQIIEIINQRAPNAGAPARHYFDLGAKFGESPPPHRTESVTETRTARDAVKWARTSLTLSPAQVVKLYQLQYASQGETPFDLITVSLPDSPEQPATPNELSHFTTLYNRVKSGDIQNLPKDQLTGMLLTGTQKMSFLEFGSIYESTDRGATTTAPGTRKRPAPDDDDGNNVLGAGNARRRRTTDMNDFQSVTGTDVGMRSTSSSAGSRSTRGMTEANNPLLTPDLTDHWKAIAQVGQLTVIKAVMRCLLMTPFSKECLLRLIDNDCVCPVGGLLISPHETYRTLLLIKILAGEATGNLMVGHRDFEIGNNPKTKVFFGHFTLNSAPVIHHPQNVRVIYDSFVRGCLGGAGVKIWNERNKEDYDPEADETIVADRFALLVSYEEDSQGKLVSPMDASGHFSYMRAPGIVDKDGSAGGHYSTCAYYNALWRFRKTDAFRTKLVPPLSLHHPWHNEPLLREWNHNTVLWEAPQANYDRKSAKFSALVLGNGPFGKIFGPGARSIRNGGLTTPKSIEEIRSSLYH